jgi:hypothetical protein
MREVSANRRGMMVALAAGLAAHAERVLMVYRNLIEHQRGSGRGVGAKNRNLRSRAVHPEGLIATSRIG